MIKERSLSVGKIYHRESNVPEVSPFHKKHWFLTNCYLETTNICHGYTQFPKSLKFVYRKFLTYNNIIRRDKKIIIFSEAYNGNLSWWRSAYHRCLISVFYWLQQNVSILFVHWRLLCDGAFIITKMQMSRASCKIRIFQSSVTFQSSVRASVSLIKISCSDTLLFSFESGIHEGGGASVQLI